MNRREFFLLGTSRGRRSVEFSCARLYMRYLDSRLDGTTAQLFERLDRDLQEVAALRLTDTAWLARDDLRQRLEPLLARFRARGGRIDFAQTPKAARRDTA